MRVRCILLCAASVCSISLFARGDSPHQTSLLSEQAPKASTQDQEKSASLDTPRSALLSFLTSSDGSTQNQTISEEILPLEGVSQNAAVRARIVNSLDQIVRWLGWSNANTNTFAPGDGFKNESWQLFPFTNKAANELVTQSNRLEAASGARYQLILQRNKDGMYRFAPESVDPDVLDSLRSAVNQLRRESGATSYNSLSDWMSLNAPTSLLDKVFFLQIWQWIGLAVVLFLGFLIDGIVRILLSIIVRRILKHFNASPDQKRIKHTIRAFGLFSAAITWFLLLSLLGLPIAAFKILQPVSKVVFIVAITWCLWRLTDLIGDIFTSRADRTDTKLDDILVPMVRKTVKAIILVFTLLNIAPLFGLEVGPLLAAVGVGTLALGFAFKNTIENFFGSVTVVLDRPFQVGDWVVCNKIEGTVEAVGMRSTRIRTFYNSIVTMPNSLLITNEVDNYGLRKYRRWSSNLRLRLDTPPELVEAYCEAIREIIRQHPYTRKDYYQVWLNEFGPSELLIMIYVFWEAPDWQTELRERHRFMLDILRLADELGVSFAYPTQTVYLDRSSKSEDSSIENLKNKSAAELRSDARQAVRKITKDFPWQTEKPPKYRFFSAEETEEVDSQTNAHLVQQMEKDLQKKEQTGLPTEDGDDPEKADYTEQRDAGG